LIMFGLEQYSPWLVWISPILGSLFVPLAAKLNSKVRDRYVILVGIITLILSVSMIPETYSGELKKPPGIKWIPVANIELGVLPDPLSVLFANLVALIGLVVLVYSLGYMAHEEGLTRYYFLMLLFIGSMNGLVMADNFLQIFIFWELVGMCSYALVSFWYKRPKAVRAGIKVFLMTKVGDIALLAGILLIYANIHTLSYKQVFEQYGAIATPMLTAISLLVLLGALAKSAQLPLHTWLYSAMEAPTSVSCLLHGATMVKGGVYLIARTHVMFCGIPVWLSSLQWIGAITALIGATLALHTSDIKGVPAYSTISQIGFMFAAFGTSLTPEALGRFASLFHMISHAFFQGLGFLAIGSIIHQLGTRDMRKMGGLMRDMPITFALCIIVILARSGIPPFCSFFSKGLIASSILSTGNPVLIFLIYSAAAVTFAYSYRFLVLTFAGEKPPHLKETKIHEAPRVMWMSSSVLAAGSIVLGFLGEPLALFLRTNFTFDLVRFFNFESLAFIGTLFIGGLPIYIIYQKRTIRPERLRTGPLTIIDKMLEHGYFFDSFYGWIVGGIIRFSNGFHDLVEVKIMEQIPHVVANGIVRFAYGFREVVEISILDKIPGLIASWSMKLADVTHRHFDHTLDKLVHSSARVTAVHGFKIRRIHSPVLPHFVLATVLGFFLLCILLLLTV